MARRSITKAKMKKHVQGRRVANDKEQRKHSKGYYIVGGIFGGIASGYILSYVLAYLLAKFIVWLFGGYPPVGAVEVVIFLTAAIYSLIFIKILTYSRDKQSEGGKWFGVGGLGIILGLFINWLICLATNKGTGSKYAVFFVSWIVSTFVGYVIIAAEVGL